MRNVLKNLKGIFIVEEEVTQPDPKPAMPAPEKAGEATPRMERSVEGNAEADARFVKILLDAIEKNNQEGFDYLEFRKSLQSLKEMQPDEPSRFRSAFAVAQTLGISKEHILASARFYLKVLEDESAKFKAAEANQMDLQVKAKEGEIQDTEQEISSMEKQIQELQELIAKKRAGLENLKNARVQAEEKIVHTRNAFDGAYALMHQQIQADLEKIQNHL